VSHKSKHLKQALMSVCAIVTVGYLTYRGLYTLNTTTWYASTASWLLYAAELWGGFSLILFFVQVWEPEEPPELPVLEDASVDVFIPTFNEDVAILRGTLQASLAMDYPHRTYLLDDGNRVEVRELCEELGVHYITRENNLHAKAGNLNHAFDQTEGDYVAILDADHVPEPNFLSRMIGYFRDPEVGFVQSPHAFSNFDTFQGRVNYEKGHFWDEGQLFYKVIQPARNATNSVIFAGSAALFRRKALKEVGYIATETITEDMHTGIRLAAKGWKCMYVSDRLIAGQGANDVTTFHNQRLRWAEGNLSILAYDNPLTMRGLNLQQRLTFFASIIHWAGGVPRLFIYLTPVLMLLTGVAPVAEFTPVLAAVFLTYILTMMLTLRVVFRGMMSYSLVEFFNMANFWTQTRATFRALWFRNRSKFVVTNKRGGRQGSTLPHILPQIILMALCLFSLVYGWTRHLMFDSEPDLLGMGIATFLVLHNAWYAIQYLRQAMTPISKRASYRHRLNMPVKYSFTTPEGEVAEGIGVTTDLNEIGLGFVSYDSLPVNKRGKLKVLVNGDTLHSDGVIRYAAHREGGGIDDYALYRYGVEYADVTPEAIDAASRMSQRYAVAPWHSVFERGGSRRSAASLLSRREVGRAPFKLPIRLETPDGEVYCATKDISSHAMRAVLASPLEEGVSLRAEVFCPMGSFFAQVEAGVPREVTGPPHRVREYVLTFTAFEGQGRSMLQSLIDLTADPKVRRDLMILHENRHRPLGRPIAAASFMLLAMSPGAVGVFKHVHSDDFKLVNSADGQLGATMEADENFERILAEALANPNPEIRRLILIKEVLEREERNEELVQICRILVNKRPDDPDLGKALVSALTAAGRYQESADLASWWITGLYSSGSVTDANEFEVLAARNLWRGGDHYGAMDAFRRIVADRPDNEEVRSEYLGLLLQANLADEALRQFSLLPQDETTKRQMVTIYSSLGRFDQAEAVTRSLLMDDPSNVELRTELANFQAWQGDFTNAVQGYRDLYRMNPNDLDIAIGLGETMTWAKQADAALEHFGALLDNGHESDRLFVGFLDSYLGAENPTSADAHRLHWMLNRHGSGRTLSPAISGRLAAALLRANFPEKAIRLLDESIDAAPMDRDLRLRLADALVEVGRHDEAHHHYRHLLADEQAK